MLISDAAANGSNGEDISGNPTVVNSAGSGATNMNQYITHNYILRT